ncbi:LacI family DNA-binding transcriptional regulator [Levilactobacillus spicheri]|uniref:LacI family transcriptional regulator n=2 Tax=Levilactobacillus spicheri TaxID=216463 RepID=A0ABQ0WR29_9LACO|nr:LacI family DNA-binding transcriptional regulator [Levilactobacillus spicheri]KRL48884.1 transcription regulator [Levilactobacillus spicheri DSM 15429]GEO67558.1 LacI family transcriptional regulator [Levilactobacillus spicheri]
MKPTIKDIAAKTNLSIATVSRVLGHKQGTYSAKAEAKVLQAARELGYRKNTVAVELVKKRADVLAVIINATPTNFSTDIIDGIQERAGQLGQQVIILYAGNREAPLQHQAINTALQRNVSGILLVAIEPDATDRELLQAAQVPFCFVSLNLDDQNIKSVSSNNHDLAYQATEYLIAHGHTRIGLAGIDDYHTGRQRLAGYQAALANHQIMADPAWVQRGNYSYQAGQAALSPYRSLGVTAVLAASDMVAAGLLTAAQGQHLTLPQDLSIVSIDGTIICDITTPALTSVTQDFREIGRQGVNRVMGQAAQTIIPVTLTERASVAELDQLETK